MIIGSGMIAKSLSVYKNNDDVLIFASGVSFSKEKKNLVFKREKELLVKNIANNPKKLFVYFSTCSIYDQSLQSSPYIKHKIDIEDFIKKSAPNYLIFRVSNLVGISSNSHTIINYLFYNILSDIPVTIWKNAHRNLLDINDFSFLVSSIIKRNNFINTTINLASPKNISLPIILKRIEIFLKKKATVKEKSIGADFYINTGNIKEYTPYLNYHLKPPYLYLDYLLNEYYRKHKT